MSEVKGDVGEVYDSAQAAETGRVNLPISLNFHIQLEHLNEPYFQRAYS